MASLPAKAKGVSLDSIDTGIARVEDKTSPNARDLLEGEEVKSVQLQNKLANSRIKNVKADRKMRKTYAGRILRYLEVYSIVVGILVIASGFGWTGFVLPSEIIATLVGSTAIAAIGLVGFIARGLFRSPPDNPSQ